MAETTNIAAMAEKLSQDLFSLFNWQRRGPLNENWDCVQQELHDCKTHPSDVVFSYDEPYFGNTTYLNFDLKSYAKGSITKNSVTTALESLAKSVSCANLSPDWQEKYCLSGRSFRVHGVLFIYNHDGAYDAKFDELLRQVDRKSLLLQRNSRLYVISPYEVAYLNTVVNDIKSLRGEEKLPRKDDCTFLYPELSRKKYLLDDWGAPATLEMLMGSVILVKYKVDEGYGLKIYYKKRGETTHEFIYLFDFLFNFQIVRDYKEVEFRLPSPAPNAAAIFENAKHEYIKAASESYGLEQRMDHVTYSSVQNFISQLYTVELGMRV